MLTSEKGSIDNPQAQNAASRPQSISSSLEAVLTNTGKGPNGKDAEAEEKAVYDEKQSGKPENENLYKGKTIVGWDGPNDPENPKNWNVWFKIWVTVLISLDTTSLYMGSAIVTASAEELQAHFHTTRTKTALGITLFVWGYGLGSLWFCPMSEIAVFRGRNPTYFGCQLLFAILQIPTALTNHLAPYAILRLLAGIFASPPLATAGATITDMWDMPACFIALITWEFGCVAGPYLGPLVGAAFQQNYGWRYVFWFMLALSGGLFVLMLFFLPETSEQELLIRKARRLRKESNSEDYIAPGEIIMHTQKASDVLIDMFYKPIKLTIMEPVLLLINLHLGLLYSVMYLFLEAMPIVYIGIYGFNLVEMGTSFVSFLIGSGIASVLYVSYVLISSKEMASPEKVFGRVAIAGAILLPAGLLVWGWLERADIFWAIGMIGSILIAISSFFMFQSYFAFLATMFPPNTVGSVFASNNIVRSLMGGAFPLFGHVFYMHTATDRYPVGWGCTILALIATIMIGLPVYLYIRGEYLKEYAQRKYGDKLLR